MKEKRDTDVEANLGLLINLSGKLRMLSHRFVMFTLLANSADESSAGYIKSAENASSEFAHIVQMIRYGDKETGVGQETLEALNNSAAISQEDIEALDYFISYARQETSHTPSASKNHTKSEDLHAFAEFVATDLLYSLNNINDGIRNALSEISARRRTQENETNKLITETILDIEKISKSVRLIALNASVEAARAGEAGRGFGVIASEIRKLSDDTTDSVKNVRAQIAKIS